MTNDLKDKKHSGELKTKMSHLANSYVNAYKPTKNSLKKHKTLKRLRENKDIVILRPDKGCGTVILDQEEFVKKIYAIINDTSKFKKLSSDPTILREGQLQRFLRTLKNKGFFTDESYDKIYPSASKPASIYGLPKIHKLNINKDNLSLRPIISSIGTYNYNLSKFLTNLLAPVIPTTNCTKDSFTFCEGIKTIRATNNFLISYDVCSLFTSIPLKETVDIAVGLLFEHNPDFEITKNELKKLFDFALSGTHFRFDGSVSDQIDSVAMGSPLCLILASLFMGYHEANWLQVFKDCEIILNRCYVDDIICLFNSEPDADKFFEILNKLNPNVKFTL